MSDICDRFGGTVRHLRETRHWSQEFLAEQASLNRSYVGEIERGVVVPSLLTLHKLACALGMNPSDLLAYSEQIRAPNALAA